MYISKYFNLSNIPGGPAVVGSGTAVVGSGTAVVASGTAVVGSVSDILLKLRIRPEARFTQSNTINGHRSAFAGQNEFPGGILSL